LYDKGGTDTDNKGHRKIIERLRGEERRGFLNFNHTRKTDICLTHTNTGH